jgi:hypothetical protein
MILESVLLFKVLYRPGTLPGWFPPRRDYAGEAKDRRVPGRSAFRRCRRLAGSGWQGTVAGIWPDPPGFADALSTQKGQLKAQLKGTQSASRRREHTLEMLNGLKQRIGLGTVGRRLMAAKQAPQLGQSSPQPLKQMVESLQAER